MQMEKSENLISVYNSLLKPFYTYFAGAKHELSTAGWSSFTVWAKMLSSIRKTYGVGSLYSLLHFKIIMCNNKFNIFIFIQYFRHIINAFLLLYQIGSCCIYVVFMATNLQALFSAFGIEIDVRIMMVIILLPLILINWVRKLKYLAPLSTVGNFITIGSFVVIFYYILREPITLEGKRPIATISEFPLFFNTVLFALEAIGVVFEWVIC